MAKNKLTNKSKDPKKTKPSQEFHDPAKDSTFTKSTNMSRQSSMEEPNEQLQNLKSLNSLLIKESFEKRQQIESLVQAKESLEAELSQRKELEGEESEKNISLGLQNGLLWVYMETQMKEMGVEKEKEIWGLKNKVKGLIGSLENEKERLSLVCEERDLARNDFELQVSESRLMKEKLFEMEKKELEFVEEIGKLKVGYDRLVGKKDELEKVKSLVVKEKDLLEENIKDTAKEVEGLRRKIERFEKEKKEIEVEKNEQSVKIDELEKEMRRMGEVISNSRKEEGILLSKVFEFERSYGEAMDREAEHTLEIGVLVEEKRELEMSIEKLMEEKDFALKSLEKAMAESEDMHRRIDKLLEERDAARRAVETNKKELMDMQKNIEDFLDKNETENVKVSGESENYDLWGVVNRLLEACKAHENKNKELVSEVSCIKVSFDQLTLEKDNALKVLDEEKKNGFNLRSKVSETEKMLEKTADELTQKKAEWQNLIKEKVEIESHFGSMTEDKDRLQKELSEAKRSFNDLKTKMESTSINCEQVLTLLKNTASLLCRYENGRKEKEEAAIAEQKLEEEIEPYATELEAIKQAFKNKETVAQDLKMKVEFMEKSIVEEQKKKNFWTLVSSATTVLAAVSFAYAATRY